MTTRCDDCGALVQAPPADFACHRCGRVSCWCCGVSPLNAFGVRWTCKECQQGPVTQRAEARP